MKVKTVGDGEPEHAVMYCVHGNEVCGKLAVERILHEEIVFEKPVKFIMANEKAYRKGTRFVDSDLNRSWHDNSGHEADIAHEIKKEIQGLTVLDLHSSRSHGDAFGLSTYSSKNLWREYNALGLENVASIEKVYNHRLENCKRIPVECGYTQSEDAIRNAYSITKNFLKSKGIIEGKVRETAPSKFEIYDKVEGSGYYFLKQNFQEVEKGEKFAVKKNREMRAEESFYPVLMSTAGYENLVGFKARKIN